ncbi:MAG: TylF/MycF/NovP-related O-methyltransferase [Bacteroidales bacterium]
MNMDILAIIEILLLVLVLFFFARYFRSLFRERYNMPESIKHAIRTNEISKELEKALKKYQDPVRAYNFILQMERIDKEKIDGDMAELGVYKGESARIIHLASPGRKLHLFDTFSGFRQKDLEPETGEAASYSSRNFADTTPAQVRRTIGKHENILFHAGHFPESARELEETTYAFVNIDADLHDPIRAGLDYFFPRLSRGGLIIVHDHHHRWPGAMKAVDEFCRENNTFPVPVPDTQNSIMLFKPE